MLVKIEYVDESLKGVRVHVTEVLLFGKILLFRHRKVIDMYEAY